LIGLLFSIAPEYTFVYPLEWRLASAVRVSSESRSYWTYFMIFKVCSLHTLSCKSLWMILSYFNLTFKVEFITTFISLIALLWSLFRFFSFVVSFDFSEALEYDCLWIVYWAEYNCFYCSWFCLIKWEICIWSSIFCL